MSLLLSPRNRQFGPILHLVKCYRLQGSILDKIHDFHVFLNDLIVPKQGHLCLTVRIVFCLIHLQKHSECHWDWFHKFEAFNRTKFDHFVTFFEKRSWLDVACQYCRVPYEWVAMRACRSWVLFWLLARPVTGDRSSSLRTNWTLPILTNAIPWAGDITLMMPLPQPTARRDASLRNSKLSKDDSSILTWVSLKWSLILIILSVSLGFSSGILGN